MGDYLTKAEMAERIIELETELDQVRYGRREQIDEIRAVLADCDYLLGRGRIDAREAVKRLRRAVEGRPWLAPSTPAEGPAA